MKLFKEMICQKCRVIYEKLSKEEKKKGIGFYNYHLLGIHPGSLCGGNINERRR